MFWRMEKYLSSLEYLLVAFVEDSIPSIYMWLITVNSGSRGSDALFWAPGMHVVDIYT